MLSACMHISRSITRSSKPLITNPIAQQKHPYSEIALSQPPLQGCRHANAHQAASTRSNNNPRTKPSYRLPTTKAPHKPNPTPSRDPTSRAPPQDPPNPPPPPHTHTHTPSTSNQSTTIPRYSDPKTPTAKAPGAPARGPINAARRRIASGNQRPERMTASASPTPNLPEGSDREGGRRPAQVYLGCLPRARPPESGGGVCARRGEGSLSGGGGGGGGG